MATVTIGGREVEIQDLSGRKAIRATKIVRTIADGWPEILSAMAEFRRTYEEENFVLLDRAEARHRFHARPLIDPRTDAPMVDEDGDLVYGPDPLGHMTDEDWEKSDNKLKIRQSPSTGETIAAIFPQAIDIAEEQVTQLLALGVVRNQDLSRAAIDGGPDAVEELLRKEAEQLLDEDLGELMELAVVMAEVVETQLQERLRKLGGRAGKFLRLFGLGGPRSPETPTTDTTSTKPSQSSSTPSPEPTGGESDEPLTEPAGSASPASSTV